MLVITDNKAGHEGFNRRYWNRNLRRVKNHMALASVPNEECY